MTNALGIYPTDTRLHLGTSLVIQWLRFCNFNAGAQVLYLVRDQRTKFHMPQLKILHAMTEDWRSHIPQLRPAAAAAAKSLQSCPTLCDPINGSPPGSPIPGILQARTLEWVANSFSNAWKWKVKENSLSRVRLLATPWTAAYQAPPSMGFSRQEYWSGVPLPSPT